MSSQQNPATGQQSIPTTPPTTPAPPATEAPKNPLPASESLKSFMTSRGVKDALARVVGKNHEAFASTLMQISTSSTLLAKCENMSLFSAALTAASMNLSINPNLGHAYIVPYNENKLINGNWVKVPKAQLQIGYKGFIQLALRSGMYSRINVREIYENQFKGEDIISGDIEIENVKGEGEIVGYLAYFRLGNGFEKMSYMTKTQANDHGLKYSQSYASHVKDPTKYKNGGLWKDEFDTMAKKTVLKLLLQTYGQLSIEMQSAIKYDQAVVHDPKGEVFEYPDNENENLITTPEEAAEAVEALKDKKAAMRAKAEPEVIETPPENGQEAN